MADHQRVAQGQCTADIGRGHLTDAVPDDRRRFDTQTGEFGGQARLQQKVGGLRELGQVDAGCRLGFGHLSTIDHPAISVKTESMSSAVREKPHRR